MSSSSAHSSLSSRSTPSSHSDALLQPKNNVEEHEDTLPHPEDILSLSQPEDVLPLRKDALPQPEDSTMPGSNRSKGRDVHIFDSSDPSTTIGGLILTNGVTNANLYDMVGIIVIFTSEFTLQNEGNITIAKDDKPLQPGNYYIHSVRKFIYNGSFIL